MDVVSTPAEMPGGTKESYDNSTLENAEKNFMILLAKKGNNHCLITRNNKHSK